VMLEPAFFVVIVEPLAEHINIMLLNTHVSLAFTVVFTQIGCSDPNTPLRFIVECHDTQHNTRFVIFSIIIHVSIKDRLALQVILLNVKVRFCPF